MYWNARAFVTAESKVAKVFAPTLSWKRAGMLDERTTPMSGNSTSVERVLQTLRKRMWTIVLVAVVTAGSALGFSLAQTPTYEASVQILIGQKVTGGEY